MAQIQEPPSAYAAVYPYNSVKQTASGHFQEWDDTPGHERIRTQHKSGSFTEIQPDGTEVHKIVGDGYYITVKDGNVIIGGQCNINIVGNAEITVGGDAITNVKGNVKQVVEKDYTLVVKGDYRVSTGGDLYLDAIGTADNPSGLYVQTGDRTVFNTDVTVHGELLADSLHSDGSVTAGTGIHAGVPGSDNPVAGISTLGGLNVGTPGPTAPGVITATTSAFAPVVSDIFGSMELFRLKVDAHIHGNGNQGSPTTPPLSTME
jgi:hypothetical protein